MRSISLILLMLVSLLSADEIPVRSPLVGESRPSWWWSCWSKNIVVLKGTIQFEENPNPDLKITYPTKMADKIFREDIRKLQNISSGYYFGSIAIDEMYFISPGISDADGRIAAITNNLGKNIYFLMPALKTAAGNHKALGGKNNQRGVFIFKHISIIPGVSLMYDEEIPTEQIESANAVFTHRSKFDYTKSTLSPDN